MVVTRQFRMFFYYIFYHLNLRRDFTMFMSVSFRYFGTVAGAMITDEQFIRHKYGKYPVPSTKDSDYVS